MQSGSGIQALIRVQDQFIYEMQITTKSRHSFLPRALGVLFLAISVFGWGLQYKLSLYSPSANHSGSLPHAKLLSQRERPVAFTVVDSLKPVSPSPQLSGFRPGLLAAAFLLFFSLPATLVLWRLSFTRPVGQISWASSTYFSFRPPPALSPSN